MLAIGWGYSKREKSSEDYFVAGRGARSWMVGISMIAALFSTVSFLAYPGELITYGPGLAWAVLHSPISYLVVGFLIIPHIMRYRITSGYELLETRFGLSIRKGASLLFILVRLLWMAFVLYLCGNAVSIVTQVPLPYVMIAVGVVTTASTVMGGIRAVLLTDVLQFIIHVGAGVLIIVYVIYRCGGIDEMFSGHAHAVGQLNWPDVKFVSLSTFDRVTILGAVVNAALWWICTSTSDQLMIQRYLCTRDVKAARRSFLHCMIGDLAIHIVLWGIAVALLIYFLRFAGDRPDPTASFVSQADRLFPHFIATVLPSGIRGILVAALFADAMQSLSSGISALGTVLVVDFKSIFARGIPAARGGGAESEADSRAREADPKALARRAKLVGLAVGVIAVSLSFVIGYVPGRNILDMTYRMSGFFVVPLFVLFAMAFFVPFATPAGAWAAIATGFGAGVLLSYWRQIVGRFVDTGEFSVILIMPCSLIMSLGAGILVSLLSRPRVGLATDRVLETARP
jgi:SSS family solute:Na+ symporter